MADPREELCPHIIRTGMGLVSAMFSVLILVVYYETQSHNVSVRWRDNETGQMVCQVSSVTSDGSSIQFNPSLSGKAINHLTKPQCTCVGFLSGMA